MIIPLKSLPGELHAAPVPCMGLFQLYSLIVNAYYMVLQFTWKQEVPDSSPCSSSVNATVFKPFDLKFYEIPLKVVELIKHILIKHMYLANSPNNYICLDKLFLIFNIFCYSPLQIFFSYPLNMLCCPDNGTYCSAKWIMHSVSVKYPVFPCIFSVILN